MRRGYSFRPRGWILALAAAACAAFVALGDWQSRRADEKVALARERDAAVQQPPLAIDTAPLEAQDVANRHVVALGTFASEATVFLGNLLAAAVGITSGYFRGRYDIAVQRIVDAWQSFPYLIIILSLLAVMGPGMLNVILSLSILVAAAASRVIRSATLSVVENQYIEAARALGAGHPRIMLRHILPNVMATIVVITTIGLGGIILAESALSFLGYGVPPPRPSWGSMLSGSGRTYMYLAPWMAIWPGVAISLVVFAFNMLGDALRDVFDPRLRGSGGGSVK